MVCYKLRWVWLQNKLSVFSNHMLLPSVKQLHISVVCLDLSSAVPSTCQPSSIQLSDWMVSSARVFYQALHASFICTCAAQSVALLLTGARSAVCEVPFDYIASETQGGLGGTCVLRGCVPKKLLSYGGEFVNDFKAAEGYGYIHSPSARTCLRSFSYACNPGCILAESAPHCTSSTHTQLLILS